MPTDLDCVMRFPEVVKTVGYKRPTLYKKIADGSFPPPFNLGARAVGWRRSTIEKWLEQREAA
jgi:prophage regulatory protein